MAQELTCDPILSSDSKPWDFLLELLRKRYFLSVGVPQPGGCDLGGCPLKLLGACLGMEPSPREAKVIERQNSSYRHHLNF